MSITRHMPGPRMSQVVVHGDTVYICGQVADDAGSKTVKEQTVDILRKVDERLALAGSDKSKLLSTQIWIADMASFAEMNEAWDAWVAPDNTPARACVESRMARPDILVEMMLIAAR